ncbi:MAG: hypothetical protein ACI8QS_001696 [Planctomycetota bacterium]|jgi:hypothetical protein
MEIVMEQTTGHQQHPPGASHSPAEPLGEAREVEPGVVVERRSFMGLCSAGLLALRGPRPVFVAPKDEPHLSLEEFIGEVLPVARELKKKLEAKPQRSAEDRYLHTLASFAVRLADVETPELRPTTQGEGVGIGASWVGDPFVVLHWRMDPGASIRPHAHTYGNVCTVGLSGRARVRNFETVAAFDPKVKSAIALRQTVDQFLGPRDINLVPLSHSFCHGFNAGPEGARGLDITTKLAERQPTPYLALDESSMDRNSGLLRGTWVIE